MKFESIGHTREEKVDLHPPDVCPRCGHNVSLDQLWPCAVTSADRETATVFLCPSKKCNKLFIAVYRYDGARGYFLERLEPRSSRKWYRSEAVAKISPDFYKIYDEALAAEDSGLMHSAGPTYRKALEFLVKDYALQEPMERYETANSSGDQTASEEAEFDMEHIKTSLLGNVIQEKIDDQRIKNTAQRAAWLGNDETHYIRKWKDHDLDDLKGLISLVIHFIESHDTYNTMLHRMPTKI